MKNAKEKDFDKAGLHWTTGKIVCLCAKLLDQIDGSIRGCLTLSGEDERKILEGFFNFLIINKVSKIGGKGNVDFDIPFIIGRALVHDIGLPLMLQSNTVDDVDKIFGWGKQASQRATLDRYAFALGIEGKTMHGSEVQGLVNNIRLGIEKWSTLELYCNRDVEIPLDILRRYSKIFTVTNTGEDDGITVRENKGETGLLTA